MAGRRRVAASESRLVLTVCLVLGLVACSSGADVDQSAVQPGAAMLPTSTPAVSTRIPSAPRQPAVALPERRRIYFTNRGDLWQMPIDNAASAVISGQQILAYAPSPDGSQLAVVYQTAENHEDFAVVNPDGSEATRLTLSNETGTPTPDAAAAHALAWSPRDQTVAVARDDGSIAVIDKDGKARQLVPPRGASRPGALAWSPDGSALAYLDPAVPGQNTGLYVVPANGGVARLLVESGGVDNSVLAATWLGTGSLAYIQGKPGSVERGGDVFSVDASSGKQQLLVGTGQFAPVSGVLTVAASPDGQQLALTVYVPGGDQPEFLSLWLLNLQTRDLTQVATARDEEVTDLWWASGALIYRSIPEANASRAGVYTGTEPFTLYQLDPGSSQPVQRYHSAG